MENLHIDINIQITFSPENRIMYCQWRGPQSKNDIMRSGAVILDLVKKHGITKVLNDNSLVVGSWYDSAQWTEREWFPEMIKAGLKQFAWIYSPDFFSRFSAEKARPQSAIVQSFQSYQEAHNWLLQN